MINVEYTASATVMGLALLDDCVPECGYGSDSSGVLGPDTERGTALVHLRGAAGALAYNIYFASSGGTFSSSLEKGSGSAGGVGLAFDSGGVTAGLDYSVEAIECNPAAGDGTCTDDTEQTRWGAAFNLGGFGVHYVFGSTETDLDIEEMTNVDLVYLVEIGAAVVGPEYRTTTTEVSSGTGQPQETTDSFLLFGMSMEF